jgi:hypothetical protein
MPTERFTIDERFCGPPRSGNGGYVCGRIARAVSGVATVRLKMPPPLGVEVQLESSAEGARLLAGDTLVGEGKPGTFELAVPPCPTFAEAERAARSYIGFREHTFPGCFVCGPDRREGDGLRIFPGSLDGGTTLAAPWTPDPSLGDDAGHVRSEFLWSALDCSGGIAVLPAPAGRALVLGELSVSIEGDLIVGQRCIVLGWPLGTEGRKRLAGSAVYAEHGRLVARARATWIEVPASTWS